jgi:peroxiredoxin-like protein
MNLLDSYVYHTDARWTGGRSGELTAEGLPRISFSAPPEFAGEPGRWTPEHLLVAAASTCFLSTFMAIAEAQKLVVKELRLSAFARLERVPGEGYRFTEVTLVPEIHVDHDRVETALKVLAKAEKSCFVTRSLKATVQIEPQFVPVALPEMVG